MRSSSGHTERAVGRGERVWGYFTGRKASFTLAWLATHRDRLRLLVLGGKRLSLIVLWDDKGMERVDHSDAEVAALRTIVYGENA